MSAQVCEFATKAVLPTPSKPRVVPASGARVYQFPSGILQEIPVEPTIKSGCLRGGFYALAAEGAAVLGLYGLWQLLHFLR